MELTKQQNDFKIKLKELEDSLLSRLSSAGGNFLGDTALVENLETTKRTAAEIELKVLLVHNNYVIGLQIQCKLVSARSFPPWCILYIISLWKVAETKVTEKEINLARESYRPAAARASLLYFILNDMYKINPLYQFSLKVHAWILFWPAIIDSLPIIGL